MDTLPLPAQTFRICTLVSRSEQYAAMRASFDAAGFTDANTAFEWFDNTAGNVHDPFATIAEVLERAAEPYVVFCHQDVLLNQGDGAEALLACIARVERECPAWGVLGNAGVRADYREFRRITEPSGTRSDGPLPQPVVSVDENFMVVRTAARLRTSRELRGFHFYGLDLCLVANRKGMRCFVVDFHLAHLSAGTFAKDFFEAQDRFRAHWSRTLGTVYLPTTCTSVFVSKSPRLVRVFQKRNAFRLVRRLFGARLAAGLRAHVFADSAG